jgi:hypothetical protein
MTWVRTFDQGAEWVEVLDGLDWIEAPLPRRWHRCRPQLRASISGGLVERCACGAARVLGDGPWLERNSRKRR